MIDVDLGELRFDEGAHLLVKRAVSSVLPGDKVAVRGQASDLALHLQVWCRSAGHRFDPATGAGTYVIARGHADAGRWQGAEQAGGGRSARAGRSR